jgi:hypothetical protein
MNVAKTFHVELMQMLDFFALLVVVMDNLISLMPDERGRQNINVAKTFHAELTPVPGTHSTDHDVTQVQEQSYMYVHLWCWSVDRFQFSDTL